MPSGDPGSGGAPDGRRRPRGGCVPVARLPRDEARLPHKQGPILRLVEERRRRVRAHAHDRAAAARHEHTAEAAPPCLLQPPLQLCQLRQPAAGVGWPRAQGSAMRCGGPWRAGVWESAMQAAPAAQGREREGGPQQASPPPDRPRAPRPVTSSTWRQDLAPNQSTQPSH